MSDEEKQAIERLKILDCDCIFYENGKCVFQEHGHYKCQKQIDIETVLNLIEKQQEEIEEWKRKYKNLKSRNKGTKEALRVSEDLEKHFSIEASNLEAEIEKLRNNNKDLLRKLRNRVKEVRKLTKYSLYKKEFSTLNKQLENKDKIIDEMAKYWQSGFSYCEDCDRIIEDYDSQRCETCIKEYFKKKVEGK